MRRIGVTILLLVLTATVSRPASGDPSQVDCSDVDTPDGTTVARCKGDHSQTVNAGSHQSEPVDLVTAVSSTPEAGTCTILATTTSEQGQDAIAFQNLLNRINQVFDPLLRQGILNEAWTRILGALPGCPGHNPVEISFRFIRDIVPPGPDPWIAPGHAITGKPAYLETRVPLTAEREFETPLGALVVRLQATSFAVDWGDGSGADSGPFASPGRPWPTGAARHTYTTTNKYDVLITQLWDARWTLAGQSGTVRGLTSRGRIDDFEAVQLQAVLNR